MRSFFYILEWFFKQIIENKQFWEKRNFQKVQMNTTSCQKQVSG